MNDEFRCGERSMFNGSSMTFSFHESLCISFPIDLLELLVIDSNEFNTTRYNLYLQTLVLSTIPTIQIHKIVTHLTFSHIVRH